MAKGKKTGGRRPGSPNKVASTAKDNIIAVFDKVGGRDKMAQWAEENQTEFFKIYARLLPVDVDVGGKDGANEIKITFVNGKG